MEEGGNRFYSESGVVSPASSYAQTRDENVRGLLAALRGGAQPAVHARTAFRGHDAGHCLRRRSDRSSQMATSAARFRTGLRRGVGQPLLHRTQSPGHFRASAVVFHRRLQDGRIDARRKDGRRGRALELRGRAQQWRRGDLGDQPVPGDYDGDGIVDPALRTPATGSWFISRSGTGSATCQFGIAGDIPVSVPYHLAP